MSPLSHSTLNSGIVPRVLHVVIALHPGGLEQLVTDWTQARLARWPGSTAIACLDEPGLLVGALPPGTVTVLHADRAQFPWDTGAVARLRSLLRAGGAGGRPYDVVHSHNLAAQQYTALAVARTGVRHVHTEHGSNPHGGSWLNRLRNRWLAGRTVRMVAVSAHTADALAAIQGWNRRQIMIIPNGVTAHPVVPPERLLEFRREWGLQLGERVIGSIGRLGHIKGYDRLLYAFAEFVCRQPHPAARLLLIGDGPERPALEDLSAQLGIRERVIFAGALVGARERLGLMDCFVLPSRSEGLSVSLLEAMAAGVPVLPTDAGDSLRVIDGGRCGWPLPDNEADWPDLLIRAFTPEGQADLAARACAAKEWVASQYSQSRTLEAYERVYRGAETRG